jgi:Arc/MetJ-type ribon-helix-helix transcriptional regulator
MGKPSKVNRMTKIVPVVQAKACEGLVTGAVNVKLTPTERLFLDVLVQDRKYETRSAALRAGLGLLMTHHKADKSFDQAIERERQMHPPRRGKYRFTRR